ncbi:MAG TPA: T9SS type A sorting domain-containing protein, partial [Ignavibacteriaceae bacterium]
AIRALAFNPSGNHTLFAGSASAIGSGAGVYEYTFSIVPVELVSFSAEVFGGKVNLSWMTATELNNYGFQVERRNFESTEWVNVGFVNGNGSTAETHYYSFSDNSVSIGNYLYRLKQLDFSGAYEYSNEISVTILELLDDFTLKQNYPNPFNPSTRISFSIPNNSFVTLKVFDVLGNEIETLMNRDLDAGSYEIEFVGKNLTSGVYFYNITAGDFTRTMKMILSK